jgi:plastocyanin
MKRISDRLPGPLRHAALLSLVFAAAAGFCSQLAAAPAIKTVEIAKFVFAPKELTVEPGTQVRWTNRDETPHTVTSQAAKKVFASPGMDLDDHFDFVFAEEGDFGYFCTVHPMMTGVVHVRKAGAPAVRR